MNKVTLLCLLVVALATTQKQQRRPIRNILHLYEPIELTTTIAYQDNILHSDTIQLPYNHTENIEIPINLDLALPLQENVTVEVSLYKLRGVNGRQLISHAKRSTICIK